MIKLLTRDINKLDNREHKIQIRLIIRANFCFCARFVMKKRSELARSDDWLDSIQLFQKLDSIDSIIDFSARRPLGMRQNGFAGISLKNGPSQQ